MTQDNKLTEQNATTFINEHFGGIIGAIVALLTLAFGIYSFEEQRRQFENSINLQTKQFIQQEKRLQRQRYTELVNILWSVDANNKPLSNSKLRTEAVKEFLHTDWIAELNLSKSLAFVRLDNTDLSGLNLQKIDLTSANLSGAVLRNINFSEANLYEANLTGADIMNFDITGADLEGAKLPNSIWLNCENIKKARNWQVAYRNKELACGEVVPTVKTINTLRANHALQRLTSNQ